MKYKTILVAGSIAFDYIFQYGDKFQGHFEGHDLSKISTCFFTPTRVEYFGGTGGNIAYSYALFGDTPHLIGVAGRDFHGEYEGWLASKGVNMDLVKVIEDGDTACAYITTDTEGNQIANFYPGASIEKQNFGVDFNDFEDPILIVSPMNLDNMIELCDQAHEAGVPYIFDPGQQITMFDSETMKRLSENAFLVILNDHELSIMQSKFDTSSVPRMIVTKGSRGSEIIENGESTEVGIVEPSKVVDPTGCGDAYRGGLLHGLNQGLSLKEACEIGAKVASKSVEMEGTQNHVV